MKKILFFFSAIALIAGMCACGNDDDENNSKKEEARLISFSCDQSDSVDCFAKEYFECKCADDMVNIKHANILARALKGIEAEVKVNGNQIVITEKVPSEKKDYVHVFDATFKIGPLQHGSYTVIMKRDAVEYDRFVLAFDGKTSTTHEVDRTKSVDEKLIGHWMLTTEITADGTEKDVKDSLCHLIIMNTGICYNTVQDLRTNNSPFAVADGMLIRNIDVTYNGNTSTMPIFQEYQLEDNGQTLRLTNMQTDLTLLPDESALAAVQIYKRE